MPATTGNPGGRQIGERREEDSGQGDEPGDLGHGGHVSDKPAGAPWYTSGAQEWNGAAETLNPRPTIIERHPDEDHRRAGNDRAP